jgi:hypothetical protein
MAITLHLAHHLEEIALGALPPGIESEANSVAHSNASDRQSHSTTATKSLADDLDWVKEGEEISGDLQQQQSPNDPAIPKDYPTQGASLQLYKQKNVLTYCHLCTDHAEGFRGEHELRRHINRVHSIVRKVWVCVDISPDKIFLANCKACRNGKRYGANYNAAAHLRRTHFNPRQRERGKDSEKRGGKDGGNYPPMEVLRHWIEQKEETS